MASLNNKIWSASEIVLLAQAQRLVIWVILFKILSYGLYIIPQEVDLAYVLVVVSLTLLVFGIISIYRLAKACNLWAAWIYIIISFIPLVNLLALLVINSKANKILKANKVKVGFMGVQSKDIKALKECVLA